MRGGAGEGQRAWARHRQLSLCRADTPIVPTDVHEAVILLFRNRPRLAAELLARALGIQVPGFTEARIGSSDRTESKPATFLADLVVELRTSLGTQAAVIVEMQRHRDERKRFTWPQYIASVRAELECDAFLLVVASDDGVAEWARAPISLGHPGLTLQPVVLGPSQIPLVTDRAEARRFPELAVLSAIAHGKGPHGFDVALATMHAAARLDEDRYDTYTSYVLSALNEAARATLEAEMKLGRYLEPTDLEKRILARGRAEGLAEGLAEG